MFKFIVMFAIMATLSLGDMQFCGNSTDFATVLYQKSIEGRDNENLIFSPLSIQTALGLAYMGANNETAEEMVNGLQLKCTNKTFVAENFMQLLEVQNNNPDVLIANKIFVNDGYKLNHKFEEIAINQFKSETENLNFTQNQESATIINNWVDNKTNHRIKELISPNSLDQDTAMILANAIYFQGSWQNKFNKYLTRKSKFWSSKNESTEVNIMSISLTIPTKHSDDLKATAIQLPYQSAGLYMMIILPDEKDGLQYLEKNLHKVNLINFAASMEEEEFDEITIPKFKINFSVELSSILEKMGMGTMLTGDADFSGMLQTAQPMKISQVVHKAFIDVNEEGTEAGAATGIKLQFTCLGCAPETFYFRADHPFFYAIMNEHGVLFTGRFVKPEE